jgi:hypothetical protein
MGINLKSATRDEWDRAVAENIATWPPMNEATKADINALFQPVLTEDPAA